MRSAVSSPFSRAKFGARDVSPDFDFFFVFSAHHANVFSRDFLTHP